MREEGLLIGFYLNRKNSRMIRLVILRPAFSVYKVELNLHSTIKNFFTNHEHDLFVAEGNIEIIVKKRNKTYSLMQGESAIIPEAIEKYLIKTKTQLFIVGQPGIVKPIHVPSKPKS